MLGGGEGDSTFQAVVVDSNAGVLMDGGLDSAVPQAFEVVAEAREGESDIGGD